jgi:hypothetical protein
MAELCCRARHCGLVSREAVSRVASRRRMRAAVVIVIAEIVVDVGGIAGVDAMSSGGVAGSVLMRRGPKRRERNIVQSRVGSIRRRP